MYDSLKPSTSSSRASAPCRSPAAPAAPRARHSVRASSAALPRLLPIFPPVSTAPRLDREFESLAFLTLIDLAHLPDRVRTSSYKPRAPSGIPMSQSTPARPDFRRSVLFRFSRVAPPIPCSLRCPTLIVSGWPPRSDAFVLLSSLISAASASFFVFLFSFDCN